ncbi:EAL domain-containing protein [Ornithinibacillus salinisoli]|uniref:EAL domain-containing protein n=1 Tax=Ornithinibacillus salinisoli TaxID=1848459 RepID=A0ABW4W2D6_9BACI
MVNSQRKGFILLMVIIVLFYGWIFLFWENSFLRSLGATIFPILAGGISCVWLIRAYVKNSKKIRYFWLILAMGMLIYTISHSSWLYVVITEQAVERKIISSILWCSAYFLFLVALIYRIIILRTSLLNRHYIFYTFIFMIVVTTISIHYVVTPIVMSPHNTPLEKSLTLVYTIIDIGILFAITSLYYFSRNSKDKIILSYVVLGFFLLIFADVLFGYIDLKFASSYGGLIDPLWVAGLIIIGLSALRSEVNHVESGMERILFFKGVENIFPYLSILILTFLTLKSLHWNFNVLAMGWILIFFLVLARQFIVIKQNEKLVDEYRYLAYHDPLTKLHNRTQYKLDINKIMKLAKELDRKVAILIIDLDRFKDVNDTLGHYIGDCLLVEASKRLQSILHPDEKIYRIGGDEFIIILPHIKEGNLEEKATTILKQFEEAFSVREYEINITPSIGISLYPQNGEDSETLMKNADSAMYLAKDRGKNNFQYYNAKLNKYITRKIIIENALRKAMENEELYLVYQPKIDLHTREMRGMEALLRWESSELGTISPAEFIPIAEETGQIIAIGKWVLKTACKRNKEWQQKGLPFQCVSVNVSVRQFQHSDFVNTVEGILHETGLNPRFLELEITESIMQNINESTTVLKGLRELGVKTSIDDFGTGYSSLHILRELPIDTIKIDKSFIDDVADSAKRSMVRTIIDLGLNLNLSVVAEGIENEQQAKILSRYKCRFGQGYLFSRPVKEDEFEKLLHTQS